MDTSNAKSPVIAIFRAHIHELCDDWEIPAHGRQTRLGEMFGVTPNTARKWLNGLGLPELEKAIEIANRADVNVAWLLQGKGLKRGDTVNEDAELLAEALNDMPRDIRNGSLDFFGFQLSKSEGFIPEGKLAKYRSLIERLKTTAI
jgi:transcriptional regulator with XRE-family HTH domain